MWTAPWQELFGRCAALAGCGQVSGLLVRQVWLLALRLDFRPARNGYGRNASWLCQGQGAGDEIVHSDQTLS